jgi:hypothetical protein
LKIISWILSAIYSFNLGSNVNKTNRINEIKINDSVHSVLSSYKHNFVGFPYQTTVLNHSGNCVIVISKDDAHISNVVIFSPDKELLYSSLPLMDSTDINKVIGKKIGSIKKQYGNVHFDIGSGVRIPSYITKNAEFVYLSVHPSRNPDSDIVTAFDVENIFDKYLPT